MYIGKTPKAMVWQCPVCLAINSWNYEIGQDVERIIKHTVYNATGSCFDNICGKCHSNIVKRNSPIMAKCYTH